MKRASLLLLFIVPVIALLSFSGIQDQIVTAIKTGNAKELSGFFGKNIDLSIDDNEGVYSKAQAELIIKEFFTNHPPESFKIIHNGTSKLGLEYAIGKLNTSNGEFRVPFFIKEEGGKKFIQQLRFDPAD